MKTSWPILLILMLIAGSGCSLASRNEPKTDAGISEEQRTIYGIGYSLGMDLKDYHFSAEEAELVATGLQDAVGGDKPRIAPSASQPHPVRLEAKRMALAAAPERQASESFVAQQAERPGATRTKTGLVFEESRRGKGAAPDEAGTVSVAYEMRLRDGGVVETSGERPATFSLRSPGTLPCFTEALLRMRVGSRARFVCPPSLAYGDRPHGALVPGGAALVVDAELIAVGMPLPVVGH